MQMGRVSIKNEETSSSRLEYNREKRKFHLEIIALIHVTIFTLYYVRQNILLACRSAVFIVRFASNIM